jgi:ribose/xylose/arabinose/galactoside ABC-type transport system permease subunit
MYLIAPVLLMLALVILVWLHAAPGVVIPLRDITARVVKEGAPLALLAMAAALVLATGGVDISTAGVATAGGAVFAALSQSQMPPAIGVLAALLFGGISGLVLGLGVHRNLPPLILSWALGALWIVATLVFADMHVVESTTSGIRLGYLPPEDFFHFGHKGFNYSVLALGIVVATVSLTNLPRRAMAVGANRDSAVYAGIRTRRTYLACYSLGGTLAALAGVLWAVLTPGAQTTEHVGRELIAIAVAILGGTVMTGGYLFLPSVVAAALFWNALDTAVRGSNLTVFQQFQHHAANGLFALLFVLILLPFGRRLAGPTQTISVEQKIRER